MGACLPASTQHHPGRCYVRVCLPACTHHYIVVVCVHVCVRVCEHVCVCVPACPHACACITSLICFMFWHCAQAGSGSGMVPRQVVVFAVPRSSAGGPLCAVIALVS